MINQNCPLCPAGSPVFTCRQKLVRHIAICHKDCQGVIRFRCGVCKETYENSSSLTKHIFRKHGGQQNIIREKRCAGKSSTQGNEPLVPPTESVEFGDIIKEADSLPSLQNQLQFKAAALLINIKEIHNASKKIVNEVISGVDSMTDSFLDILENHISNGRNAEDILTVTDILKVIEKMRGQSLFEGVNSTDKLLQYMMKEQGVVEPKKVVLLKKQVIKNNMIKDIDVEWGYIIPFLPSLEKILALPEVLQCIDNPRPVVDGKFISPLDGYFYSSHPVVKDDPHTLGLGIYSDSVDLTDSASSKSGAHPVTFMYFIIFNIYPEFQSSVKAIFLLGCVKTSFLKHHGFAKFLEDFIAGINKLSSSEGVSITINGVPRVFHGIFICCCGDNPASENCGGFKESHFARKPCRQCEVARDEMFKHFKEKDFPMRSKDVHAVQLRELEDYLTCTDKEKESRPNPSVQYGINGRSSLMNINGCDVTKCLPQDFMHDTIEGTLKLEMSCLLSHVIDSKKLSLPVINQRIELFGKHFGVNKPGPIQIKHLQKKRLRLTAAETLTLAYMLPFVLRKKINGSMVSVCGEENLHCFVLRLRLLDILMSYELTIDDVYLIRRLTDQHHTLFMALYNCPIPKMHFEVHYATQILLYGPVRHHWCFRFEGKHAYFRRLLRIFRCFKNPSKTFAWCHQTKLSGLMLLSAKGDSGPFLQGSDKFGAPTFMILQSLAHSSGLLDVLPGISRDSLLSVYKVVSVNGVTFKKKCAIMVSIGHGTEPPQFGEVVHIVKYQDTLALVYKRLDTASYMTSLRAFRVTYRLSADFGFILASRLPYSHKLFSIKSVGAYYIVAPNRTFGPN